MDRQYDIFQVLADAALLWRETVTGHEAAMERLEKMALLESSEFQLLHLPDRTVLATMNARKSNAPRVIGPKP